MSFHPIYDPFGFGDHLNNLRGEFEAQPAGIQQKWLRRAKIRSAVLRLTGQSRLQRAVVPSETRKLLWLYDWSTIGDTIMDLSQRFSIPSHIQVDACICNSTVELFVGDSRFTNVFASPLECPSDYDFVLLHDISSKSIRFKTLRYPGKPWASMLNFQHGEQFSRVHHAARRIQSLFALASAAPDRPRLPGQRNISNRSNGVTTIAVALGSIDPRRVYSHWQTLFDAITAHWQASPKPARVRFRLIGSGDHARNEFRLLRESFVGDSCDVRFDLPSLTAVREAISSADCFIGADTGLMHIAEALDIPGVGLFGGIRPEWRLLPSSRIAPLFSETGVADIAPERVLTALRLNVAI